MRKIIIIADSYLPGYKGGGPVVSVANFVNEMKFYFDILVCTSAFDYGESKPYKNIPINEILNQDGYKIKFLRNLDLLSLGQTIKEFQPNCIYLNSFFSPSTQKILLLNRLLFNKKLVIAPRGELQTNALNIKKNKKRAFLLLSQALSLHSGAFFHATSEIETRALRSELRLDGDRIVEIPNIAKVHKFKPLEKDKDELKLVFISRICRKKNLDFAIRILSEVEGNVSLDIFGPIEDIDYWNLCQSFIKILPENVTVTYKGCLDNKSVIGKMRQYHSLLFPTLSENYGHVIVEAMQAGLVPIISNKTPWVDLVDSSAGWSIPLHSSAEFITAIDSLYSMSSNDFSTMSRNAIIYILNKVEDTFIIEKYKEFFNEL